MKYRKTSRAVLNNDIMTQQITFDILERIIQLPKDVYCKSIPDITQIFLSSTSCHSLAALLLLSLSCTRTSCRVFYEVLTAVDLVGVGWEITNECFTLKFEE